MQPAYLGRVVDGPRQSEANSAFATHIDISANVAGTGMPFMSAMSVSSSGPSSGTGGGGTHYLISLQLQGLAGLPGPGVLERPPGYELIVHAGSTAKRIRPRVPAPPPGGAASGNSHANLEELVPQQWRKAVLRLDERLSLKLREPVPFFHIDVYEERNGFMDWAAKSPTRKLLGQCYVPLEQTFNRRPCSWTIVKREDRPLFGVDSTSNGGTEVGCLTCKFSLATSPGPVRNLRTLDESIRSHEVQLAWDPPSSDVGTVLRGYRVEATDLSGLNGPPLERENPLLDNSGPRTASAPPNPAPRATLRGLRGNTAYKFKVWAMNEAGPGPAAEIIGCTGAVPPGACGKPYAAEDSFAIALAGLTGIPDPDEIFNIEWTPPRENGGATIVAYRVWLRPLHTDSLGTIYTAEGWIDLGLCEHKGEQRNTQRAPVRLSGLPSCSGLQCSVAAISAAGHTGQSTPETIVISPVGPQSGVDICELPQDQVWHGHTDVRQSEWDAASSGMVDYPEFVLQASPSLGGRSPPGSPGAGWVTNPVIRGGVPYPDERSEAVSSAAPSNGWSSAEALLMQSQPVAVNSVPQSPYVEAAAAGADFMQRQRVELYDLYEKARDALRAADMTPVAERTEAPYSQPSVPQCGGALAHGSHPSVQKAAGWERRPEVSVGSEAAGGRSPQLTPLGPRGEASSAAHAAMPPSWRRGARGALVASQSGGF